MNNYIVPVTIIDNFFDDPLWVRNYGLGLSYTPDPRNQWPGERTASLNTFDKDLLGYTINKFLSLYYNFDKSEVVWSASGAFQKISSKYKDGWIHTDPTLITIIIFLNDETDSIAGTTLYEKKKETSTHTTYLDKKSESFNNTDLIETTEEFRKQNNDQFIESVVIKNKFNRLLAFDSHLYHSANNFSSIENRLTLTLFIEKLTVDNFPLQRTKTLSL